MTKLEKLIEEFCPNGVKCISLEELGVFYGGITGKTKDDFKDGNAKFITYKNVYANPALNLDVSDRVKIAPEENQRTLQYGDVIFTGSSETPEECGISSVLTHHTDEKLYLNSFCFVFRFNDLSCILPDFAKHLFRSNNLRYQIRKTASGVTRFNVSKDKMKKVVIPLPPIEIQSEIVSILDNFTELTTELTAELTARKKQYAYYLDQLYGKSYDGMLSLDKKEGYSVLTLSDIGTITRGKRFVKADSEGLTDGVPCIHYGELYTYYGVSATKSKSFVSEEIAKKLRFAHKNDVIIVGAGENNIDIGVGVAWFGEDIAVHDACYIFTHELNPKYVSYYLRTSIYHSQIKRWVSEGKICSFSAQSLGKVIIPVAPMKEQNRIVSILEHFDDLSNNISSGLPAEIEARKKQYEYYRDKLLTFKKLS